MKKLHLLYEDEWLAVAEKPAGIASEAKPGTENMLQHFAAYLATAYPGHKQLSAGLPHRLDKPVSGLLLLSKRPRVLKELSNATPGTWKKYYLAVLQGHYKGPAQLVHYTAKESGTLQARAQTQPWPGAKKAMLGMHILGTDPEHTYVFIDLLTGRYHQIRVQFAAQGFPLLGDTLYTPGIVPVPPACIALHACKLMFTHPVTKERMIFRSESIGRQDAKTHPALSKGMHFLSNSVYF